MFVSPVDAAVVFNVYMVLFVKSVVNVTTSILISHYWHTLK